MLECIVIKFFNEVIFKETDCPSQRGLSSTYTRIYQMYCSQSQRIGKSRTLKVMGASKLLRLTREAKIGYGRIWEEKQR
jgi:hypothetical protein